MKKYRFSDKAIDDIDLMYVYGVQVFGVDQANRYQDQLFETFSRLADFPDIGLLHSSGSRRFPHWPYIIFYSYDETMGLVIEAVLHGRQDWQKD
ncbi:MAG: type II toxin-antitoxin system RelE/ParE family toxin [Pseudomonadota bacterium]